MTINIDYILLSKVISLLTTKYVIRIYSVHYMTTWAYFCYASHVFVILLVSMAASLVAQMVKNLPEMQEIQVWSLCWEDPLEKEMATHSSIFAWRIPWTEEPSRLQSMGSQRVRHSWVSDTTTEYHVMLLF